MWRLAALVKISTQEIIARKGHVTRFITASIDPIYDVIQIKDTTSRGTWKIGRIIELVSSQDGLIRAAKVILPNKTVLQRSIVHLFPLECSGDTRKTKEKQT